MFIQFALSVARAQCKSKGPRISLGRGARAAHLLGGGGAGRLLASGDLLYKVSFQLLSASKGNLAPEGPAAGLRGAVGARGFRAQDGKQLRIAAGTGVRWRRLSVLGVAAPL